MISNRWWERVNVSKNMTITVESYIGKVGKEGVKLEQQYLIGENDLN